jgi:hypothetical protein
MKPTLALLLGAAALSLGQEARTRPDLATELDEIGRVATVLVDGDACQRIMTRRALEFLDKKDPKDPWVDSDNFDVNHEPYIQVKKTLIRLARLAPFPVDVNLWMPVEGLDGRIQVLIRNRHEMSQFWRWGALHQEMHPSMKTVLEEGRRVKVTDKPGWVSVLAPVRDSLGDVVGLVEVVSRTEPDDRENVK